MRDSREIDAERALQHSFRILEAVQILTLLAAIVVGGSWIIRQPNRSELGTRITHKWTLGVGALDNIEALAPESLPNGQVRLWMMTDDNFHRPLRTLLIAVDVP